MALDLSSPDVREIHAAITARMQELKPLVEECWRLERAEAALAKSEANLNPTPEKRRNGRERPVVVADSAPYGYKADGVTPRKRRRPGESPRSRIKT